MGHYIRAVIGSPDAVERVVVAANCPAATTLSQGLVIAPLGHEQIDALTKLKPGEYAAGFGHLSEGLKAALLAAIGSHKIAYVETDYFGGTGSQGAAVLDRGTVTFESAIQIGPARSRPDDPINTALRALGVKASAGRDEFETVGLPGFSDLESLGIVEEDD